MNTNLAHEPPIPQGEVVRFPKKERQQMSKREEGHTRMPNSLIDDQIMAQLNDKAFKCLMFIVRQTSGFNRTSHTIAITQFQKYCGIKKRDTVMSCIKELEELKLIKVERQTGCLNEYFLTLDQYHEMGLVTPKGTSPLNGDGTSTAKRDEGSPIEQDGTSTVERGTIKETFKETFKENFKERETQQNPVDQVLNLWTPDLHSLNSWLQRSGEMPMTQDQVNQVLLEVNAHYEQKFKSGLITETQMYSNFVKWIKRKFSRNTNTHQHKQSQVSTSRNVNDAWGDVTQYAPCSTDDIDLGDLV